MIKNILSSPPPEEICIDGTDYPIYTSFKNWIKIDSLISDKSISNEDKLPKVLALCYRKLPKNAADAIDGLLWFYSGGAADDKNNKSKKTNKYFDFEYDGDLIYSAFFAQYNIDLLYDELHWWQFLALFKGLGSEHKFSKAVGYRMVDLSEIKDSAARAFYKRMKRIYALRDRRTEEEKTADIAETMSKLF